MPGPLEFAKALFSLEADSSKMDAGLSDAEKKAEAATQRISAKMVAFSAAVGGAIGAVVGGYIDKVLDQLERIPDFFADATKVTAEFGEKMEQLGNEMGMTAQQAATLTGVMERHGIAAGVAARSMQIMAMEAKETGDALDPLNTRLGRVLGTLRDSDGKLLDTSQILDLARQKIQATSGATEQLQLAQQIFGTRMGGQLLPLLKLSNEEWEKQKASVTAIGPPVEALAEQSLKYKEASAELNQVLQGLQLTIGNALLPGIIEMTKEFSQWVRNVEDFKASDPFGVIIESFAASAKDVNEFVKQADYAYLKWNEIFGDKNKYSASADMFALLNGEVDKYRQEIEAAGKAHDALLAKAAPVQPLTLSGMSQEQLAQVAKAQQEMTAEEEKAQRLGVVTAQQRADADTKELAVIKEQLSREEAIVSTYQDGSAQQIASEEKILGYKVREAEIVSRQAQAELQSAELVAKARGTFNSTTEIQFLEQQLRDARIVGDERLKIEADLFNKKKAYEEEAVKLSRELGFTGVQDELKFRQEKTKQLLASGDVAGAAGEMKKVRDLQIQEADSAEEFEKKVLLVSIGDQIDFQKRKLDLVKGNAQEERKVLEEIADLDKQLYDRRTQFALDYVSNVNKANQDLTKAGQAGGEILTASERRRNAERQDIENARQAGDVLHGGGTEAQWQASAKWAQDQMKMFENMQQMGQELTEAQKNNQDVAKDILSTMTGEATRAPGSPSPLVGSILSSSEGLATSSLARGSEIPRLDTSFADMAIRVRDVFLGTIPNIQSFSNALAQGFTTLTKVIGNPINLPPGGGLGPGGGQQFGPGSPQVALPTGPGTPAQPPFGTPTPGTGQGGTSGTITINGVTVPLGVGAASAGEQSMFQPLLDAIKTLNDSISDLKTSTDSASNQKPQQVQVSVGVDPNSGDALATVMQNNFIEAISPTTGP